MKTITKNLNPELTFSTADEHQTVLLHGLCEKVCAISDADLHQHLQHLEFIFAEANKSNPHLVEQNLKTFSFINQCFLTGSLYGQLAHDIYEKLNPQVKNL